MDLDRVAVRCVVAWLVLLVLVRVSGKRTVHQGIPFDFVLALVIGDLVDDVLWAEVSVARFVVAAGTLTLLDVLASMAGARSSRLFHLLAGEPTVVVAGGQLIPEAQHREWLSDREVERGLHEQGMQRSDLGKVEKGTIETDGYLSVILSPRARAATRKDLPRLRVRIAHGKGSGGG